MNNLMHFLKLLLLTIVISTSSILTAQNFQYVVNNNPNIHFLLCVHFPNPAVGYAVGDSGTIVKTIDSGYTWQSVTSNTLRRLFSVKFINADTGWVVGDSGIVRKTTDGGISWINQDFGSKIHKFVYFLNNDTGFIAGGWLDSSLYKTTDGGNNWFVNFKTSYHGISSINFNSAGIGFAGGYDTIFTSTDSGNNWAKIGFNQNSGPFVLVDFPNSNKGYAFANWSTYISTNGGNSWFFLNDSLYNIPDLVLESSYFTSGDTGYIVGNDIWSTPALGFMGSYILKTTNGGNSWNSLNNIASNDYLNYVYFTNSASGIIVGGKDDSTLTGIIIKSTGIVLNIAKNNNKINEILIYPNPTTNELNIEIPQNIIKYPVKCEIINTEGQVILKENLTKNISKLDINQLNDGFYILKIKSESKVIIKKLIKQ
jgi:photosystem II stability/assembly factor-like uncharacterized protein